MISKLTMRILITCLLIIMTTATMAANKLQCLLTVNKDPMWSKENLAIEMIDDITGSTVLTVNLAAANKKAASVNSVTKTFDCIKHPKVFFKASYSPPIWSSDKGQVFSSQNLYDLSTQILGVQSAPATIQTTTLKIIITFPEDFLDVPLIVN